MTKVIRQWMFHRMRQTPKSLMEFTRMSFGDMVEKLRQGEGIVGQAAHQVPDGVGVKIGKDRRWQWRKS